jgi:uncharacterized phiE125 gp8 family phage protein
MAGLLCGCGCGGARHGASAAGLSVTVRATGAPGAEPVTLAEAKLYCRVDPDLTLEDALIQTYIAAARGGIEDYTERTWAPRELEARYSNITAAQLALPLFAGPVQGVTAVAAVAADGALTALTGWRFDPATVVVWPPPEGWPASPASVAITYDAGPAVCPDQIRQACLLLVGEFYDHRAAVHVGSSAMALPYAVEWLLSPHRASTGVVLA